VVTNIEMPNLVIQRGSEFISSSPDSSVFNLRCGHPKPVLSRRPYENVPFKRRHLIVTFETFPGGPNSSSMPMSAARLSGYDML